MVFWTVLLQTYAGPKICWGCDKGRFHPTKAGQEFLAAPQEQREVYWLAPYCPSLTLIERLWGPLNRTG